MNTVQRAIRDSSRDFMAVVWPSIGPMIGGGQIVPVETVTSDSMNKTLDMLAGIDAWQVINNVGVRGIASRVQWDTAWDSFTIRTRLPSGNKTEYHKRVEQLSAGDLLLPEYTIQGYVDKRRGSTLLSAAAIRTRDLFTAAWHYQNGTPKGGTGYGKRTAYSGEEFMYFNFEYLQQHFTMHVITPEQDKQNDEILALF